MGAALDARLTPLSHDYTCVVLYCSTEGSGVISRTLATHDQAPSSIDWFAKGMALLGAAGWELVALLNGEPRPVVFHGPNGTPLPLPPLQLPRGLRAHFKRPIQEGRAVDEPLLSLAPEPTA